jgi:hypothetical protein
MSFWRFILGLPNDPDRAVRRSETEAEIDRLGSKIAERNRSIDGLARQDQQVQRSSIRVTDKLAKVVEDHSRLTEAALRDPF